MDLESPEDFTNMYLHEVQQEVKSPASLAEQFHAFVQAKI